MGSEPEKQRVMIPRRAGALACAYFLGWSLVLAALIMSAKQMSAPVFLTIEQHQNDFLEVVAIAWLCFSIPCLLVVLGLNPELRSKIAHFPEGQDKKPK